MADELLAAISEDTGLTPHELSNMDWVDIDSHIEKRIGNKLSYDRCTDQRIPVRGSVYLMLGRFIDQEWVNKRLAEIPCR